MPTWASPLPVIQSEYVIEHIEAPLRCRHKMKHLKAEEREVKSIFATILVSLTILIIPAHDEAGKQSLVSLHLRWCTHCLCIMHTDSRDKENCILCVHTNAKPRLPSKRKSFYTCNKASQNDSRPEWTEKLFVSLKGHLRLLQTTHANMIKTDMLDQKVHYEVKKPCGVKTISPILTKTTDEKKKHIVTKFYAYSHLVYIQWGIHHEPSQLEVLNTSSKFVSSTAANIEGAYLRDCHSASFCRYHTSYHDNSYCSHLQMHVHEANDQASPCTNTENLNEYYLKLHLQQQRQRQR